MSGRASGLPADAVDRRVVREFWDRKAQEERTRWTSEEMLEFELGYLGELAPSPAAILDLGSGHGELSRPLSVAGTRLVAVDFAGAFARAFTAPGHDFVEASVTEFETAERFDLVLLFGVVTSLDEADELPLYRKMASWLADGGVAVVKNQCALEEEFVTAGYSTELGAEYSGRYPLADNQAARLRRAFGAVEPRAYPERFNAWRNSAHFAFVCRTT
jgi:hypothetical protein